MQGRAESLFYSIIYILVFLIPFGILPSLIIFGGNNVIANHLLTLVIISTVVFLLSLNLSFIPAFSFRKISLDFNIFFLSFFAFFLLTSFVIVFTAPAIPLIETFKGADAQELSEQREQFLKARTGVFAALGYIIGIINSYFLPYLIIRGLERKHKYILLVTVLFFIYTLITLEKAYFLKIGIPFFIYYFIKSENKAVFTVKGLVLIISMFFIMYSFAKLGEPDDSGMRNEFFSILYAPSGIFESFIWRAAVVPLVTALDGLYVFTYTFESNFFMGDTSSFLAFIKGTERINFERFLYQFQFGGSDTGNANQFYVLESYVNFGYIGIILFSMIVGKVAKFTARSNDIALKCTFPLLIFNIFNAGLIGNMFSNGLLFFLLFVVLFKLK